MQVQAIQPDRGVQEQSRSGFLVVAVGIQLAGFDREVESCLASKEVRWSLMGRGVVTGLQENRAVDGSPDPSHGPCRLLAT